MTCLVDMKIPGYDHVVFNHQERNLGSLIDMLKLLLRNLGSLVDMKIPRYVAAKLLLLLADIIASRYENLGSYVLCTCNDLY
jgi:hypothetical protein